MSDRKSLSEEVMFHLILDGRVGVVKVESSRGRKRSTCKGCKARKTLVMRAQDMFNQPFVKGG